MSGFDSNKSKNEYRDLLITPDEIVQVFDTIANVMVLDGTPKLIGLNAIRD